MKNTRNERRSGKDRRNLNSFPAKTLFINGRRENIRRQEDRHRIFYVDRFSPTLFIAIVAVLILSVIDAFLTLFLLDHGAIEINPVMAFYIDRGPYTFLTVKYLLTSFAVIVLLMFRNIFLRTIRIQTHSLFFLIIAAFMTVITWQFYLIFTVTI
jgi:hypothetical protein